MKIITITKNKKAYFDYEIIETFEAWIKLFGHEVKSVRNWHVNLKGSYISWVSWIMQIKWMHITPWKALPNNQSLEPKRDRDIFLHKKTISKLNAKQKESGLSIIPLELYFKWSLIKVKVWLCLWRKKHDKRNLLKERTLQKEAKVAASKYI